MALIEWKQEFSVNIDKFDAQHKVLIGIINELHEALKKGQSKSVLEHIFKKLIDYTKYHFTEEEKVLKENGYITILHHQAEHKKLTAEIEKLYGEFKEGKTSIGIEVMKFLSDWLQNHILKTDKKYSEALNAKGIV